MAYIFISYRHSDSEGHVGRLLDHLEKVYSKQEIFRDLDSLRGGDHFTTACEEEVKKCHIFLPIIGPQWINIRNDRGQRRLDDPKDAVRGEIVTALRHSKRIIPVLVGRAQIPKRTELPKEISMLFDHKAIEVSPERYNYDVDTLINAVGGGFGVIQVYGPSKVINPEYEIYIDRKVQPFHPFFSINLQISSSAPPADVKYSFTDHMRNSIFPVEATIKAGIHKIFARTSIIIPDLPIKWEHDVLVSDEVTFEIKAGQSIQFIIEHDTSKPAGINDWKKKRLFIKPHDTVFRV